jgi:1,4-dihydroxy-2-naphthoate octaprenyltransferase
VAPIIVASGIANTLQAFDWVKTLLALAVALFLQIGVNYANDYSDGVRGTDSNRVGPLRLTGSGTFKPQTVKLVAFAFLGLGGIVGLALIAISGLWWLIGVGAVAILAAWFYTGGKRPYGYAGLGELVVFVFFGIVAVFGTVYVQFPLMFESKEVLLIAAPGAIGLGLFASAVLMINNIRDIETDRPVGKKTLAVRGQNTSQGNLPGDDLASLGDWLHLRHDSPDLRLRDSARPSSAVVAAYIDCGHGENTKGTHLGVEANQLFGTDLLGALGARSLGVGLVFVSFVDASFWLRNRLYELGARSRT